MEIQTLSLPLPLRLGHVNAYLVHASQGYFLVDAGSSFNRRELGQLLAAAGCQPGNLRLIIITHGDFDHIGCAADIRAAFNAPIGMHSGDWGMAVRGDMYAGRGKPNLILGGIAGLLFRFGKSHRFTPDLALGDGDDLASYGLEATVFSIPGHSRGSIGILTADGDFFCGDLMTNHAKPAINDLIDDLPTARQSVEKLKALPVKIIYPGHGDPFTLEEIT